MKNILIVLDYKPSAQKVAKMGYELTKAMNALTIGNAAPEILKKAKELQADIIVMGSHSRRWLEKIRFGSVTK
jgi:nucleotide-binding universal stress UspA family protein